MTDTTKRIPRRQHCLGGDDQAARIPGDWMKNQDLSSVARESH